MSKKSFLAVKNEDGSYDFRDTTPRQYQAVLRVVKRAIREVTEDPDFPLDIGQSVTPEVLDIWLVNGGTSWRCDALSLFDMGNGTYHLTIRFVHLDTMLPKTYSVFVSKNGGVHTWRNRKRSTSQRMVKVRGSEALKEAWL